MDWWLIDSSKLCLKIILLQNGNSLPSIPLGHAVYMNKTHEIMIFLCMQFGTQNTVFPYVNGTAMRGVFTSRDKYSQHKAYDPEHWHI